jgi:hypothetical protein
MIVAASTTLLADSRSGRKGGALPWALLVAGSVASLAANVAVAEPSLIGRVIAAWPSFALIASYELLMGQVRRAAEAGKSRQRSCGVRSRPEGAQSAGRPGVRLPDARRGPTGRGREAQLLAWQWALANQSGDGALPSGRASAASMAGTSDGADRSNGQDWLANWTRRPGRRSGTPPDGALFVPTTGASSHAEDAGSRRHRSANSAHPCGHVPAQAGIAGTSAGQAVGLLTGMPPWAWRPCGRVRPRQSRAVPVPGEDEGACPQERFGTLG